MLKTIVRFLVSIFIFPIAVGATTALYRNIDSIERFTGELHIFSWGAISYFLLHLFFYKPTFFYVLGHEAVHAVAAWLCGGKVSSFRVGKEGGRVTTDKSNLFISLSPYFVPLYTILVLIVYFIVSASYDVRSQTFMYLIGFTIAFHVVSTVEAIKIHQPDIIKSGALFSIILVYILNVFVVSLLFGVLFPGFAVRNYFGDFFTGSIKIYLAIFSQLFL